MFCGRDFGGMPEGGNGNVLVGYLDLDYYGWFLQNDYPSFKEAVAKLHKKIAD